jgi:S-adenosylmethionine decarboxylase
MDNAGRHLIIDGKVKDASVFTVEKLVTLFQDLAKALDMHIIRGPEFVEVPVDPKVLRHSRKTGEFEDEGGISGTCVISTSHMSLHAWPLRKAFSADVFSCKDFDHLKALGILSEELGVTKTNITVLNRLMPR